MQLLGILEHISSPRWHELGRADKLKNYDLENPEFDADLDKSKCSQGSRWTNTDWKKYVQQYSNKDIFNRMIKAKVVIETKMLGLA